MTDAVVALEPIPLVTSRDWRRAVQERVARSLSNLSANWPRVLLGVVIGLVITLVLGVLAPRPADGPVRGGLGWFALSGITTGLATRLCMVGPRAFVHDVAGFPGRIVAMVIDAGDAAAIHLLLGFASGTLITWLLGPFLAGVTGVGLLLALGTFLRPIVVGASMVVWRWVVTRIAPRSPVSTPIDGMAVSLLSASAAMALTSLIPSVWARAALGIGAVVLALLLRRPARRTGLDLVITVVVGVAAAAVAGVLLVESAGRLDPRDAVGLALGGFALGVCLTTAARSVWPVLGALASGASRWAGACLGAALGGILGLVIGTPTISVALAAVVGVLLLVPTLAEAVSSPVARGVAPLTGSAAPETGLQLLAVGCLALLVAGLTNAAVALAIGGVAIVALVGVRWGARAVTGAATVVVLMATGGSGPAPARARKQRAPLRRRRWRPRCRPSGRSSWWCVATSRSPTPGSISSATSPSRSSPPGPSSSCGTIQARSWTRTASQPATRDASARRSPPTAGRSSPAGVSMGRGSRWGPQAPRGSGGTGACTWRSTIPTLPTPPGRSR
ncbi:MAG: hypothetical protein R3C32_00690 [Chloroflexota bacterium]